MNVSRRLAGLGSAIFAEVAEWKAEARRAGMDVIDLGIGSPDRPPSPAVMQTLSEAAMRQDMYGYPSSRGLPAFRETVSRWYRHRFGVELDADREVLSLMGSQDGLAHLALALTNPQDIVMVPDPGYPIYTAALTLAGARPSFMPLIEENGFLPDLDHIPESVRREAVMMVLNYPSNPVAAVADRAFFEKAVQFARDNEIWLVHDLAYSEMAFDGYRPVSVMEVPGAKEVAVEFHSLSKSFNMAGCRIGFAVGNRQAIAALDTVKSNIDYGVFEAVQLAGIAAMEEDMRTEGSVAALYEARRDAFLERLAEYGWRIRKPKATMFVWAKVPAGWSSRQISREMLRMTGVVVIPGDAFGEQGQGYVRIALVQDQERLLEAADRIGKFIGSRLPS